MIEEPRFLYDSESSSNQLDEARALLSQLREPEKSKLERDIALMEYGAAGEAAIAYELRNAQFYIDKAVENETDYLVKYREATQQPAVEPQINITSNNAVTSENHFPRTGEQCPRCQEGHLVGRKGPRGEFYGCSRFPKCRFTAQLD